MCCSNGVWSRTLSVLNVSFNSQKFEWVGFEVKGNQRFKNELGRRIFVSMLKNVKKDGQGINGSSRGKVNSHVQFVSLKVKPQVL